MFGRAVEIVVSVLLIVGTGFYLRHIGWFGGDTPTLLSRLTTSIGLPATTIVQLFTRYTRESLLESLPALGIAYLSVGIVYLISAPAARLAHIPPGRRGVFRAVFTFGNTIFIGLPINQALFGEAALPATLLYYVANTSLFYSVGLAGIQRDGGQLNGRIFSLAFLKKMATVPLITFLLCVVAIFAGVSLPGFLLNTAQYMGGIVTPISLFFIGTMLYDMVHQGIRWEKGYGAAILSRFVISPGLTLLLMAALGGLSPLAQSTYLVQAAMPVQASCAIVAHAYGADARYATGVIMITTLMSILTIPLFAVLTTVL